jgi:hypothetical protein
MVGCVVNKGLTMARRNPHPMWDTPPGDDREFVSVRETMRISGLGRTKLYQLMGDGLLEYIKIGKRRLVVRRSISNLGR